LMYLRGYLNF